MSDIVDTKLHEFCFHDCPYRDSYINKLDASTLMRRNIIETVRCENEKLCEMWASYITKRLSGR